MKFLSGLFKGYPSLFPDLEEQTMKLYTARVAKAQKTVYAPATRKYFFSYCR